MIISETLFDMEQTDRSRLPDIDFNNLPFGRVFSDHMFVMDYHGGKWQKGKITPFKNLSMNPATSVIHYGQSIFEGMKAFRGENNSIYLFRPDQNIARFNRSAERMCMPSVDPEVFKEALVQLITLDRNWVPDIDDAALYIRPFMFGTDEYIGVRPSESYRFMIFTCPVGKYYAGDVKVKIEMHYSRSVRGGTGAAKAAGNYAAALYPAKLAQEEGFQQLIWTDALEHKYIEESGTMNIVFRNGNTVFSPQVSDTILRGITRESVLELAREWGYHVEERPIEVAEVVELLQSGQLSEAFGAGTAATIAPISTIHYDGVNYELPPYEEWTFAQRAAKEMNDIKKGRVADRHRWNLKIV
jgi:branched-chain amino acid aminotransferase